jgi:hypothetical protein
MKINLRCRFLLIAPPRDSVMSRFSGFKPSIGFHQNGGYGKQPAHALINTLLLT